MKKFIYLSVIILSSCSSDQSKENEVKEDQPIVDSTITTEIDTVEVIEEPSYIVDTLEQKIIDAGLVDIQTVDPSILVDLKYSSTDNFMEKDVYGYLGKAYLQPTVAEDLAKCQAYLKSKDSSLSILVYDAVRPRSVQQYMWDILDMPINEKVKFVSNPKNGSIHNYGCAVDLTIANIDGEALDMGAGYDDSRKIAYPRHEQAYLDSGMLSQQHLENRELLRETMKAGGFWNIQTEWWHFNRYNRAKAKELYQIIE
ncbi:M15 family metallopeptidase [Paracrocinitomix mangrovi]|uniref:M15 family metallopeptidase n=1 Tax=Paracrocinitomix mangrovi TaxID=2862509 RepID=UPI001C8E3B2F|nr:M15 family metallopeptidase [Paracrocinitomix mangrovi]UKN01539.1 M15 family metallopeptidase [Paracrocinitomix mangrovi]